VTWKREGGTFDDFDSAADPAYRPIFFGPDGMSLSSNGPIAHPKARVTIDRKQEWPTWEHLKRTLLQPAQQLSTKPDRLDSFGYKVTLHNPTDLLGRPPPLSAAKVRFARMGKWEIEGFKWQMKLIRQLPPNMVLDSLVIELRTDGGDQRAGQLQQGQLQQGLHFHAEGKFYVY
jgi:hypothetical protein